MSNPAVIKLRSGKIGKCKVWLDDNFGESIHIHIDDHRVDLTVQEFQTLYKDLCETMNDLFPIKGLNFFDIDPVLLEVWLWPILPSITHVKYDKVYLEDLWAPYKNKCYKLKESVGVKALKGVSDENEGFRKSHHVGQSDKQRLNELLHSIRENGYPYQNKYIVLLGDVNVIYDGQHRASCLYYLHGNIEIPVVRLYSDKFSSKKPKESDNNMFILFLKKVHREEDAMMKKIKNIMSRALGTLNYHTHVFLAKKRKPFFNMDVEPIFKAK